MDYRSLGDIFKGLAASGAWGCFDEFNRLIPEVLSVCTVQYKAVTDAIRMGLKEFLLMGDMMSLIPSAMAFITMNPGYLGRSELPEGLKALFRPITVMVPDFGLICENMLMAEGFETAVVLGKRFFGPEIGAVIAACRRAWACHTRRVHTRGGVTSRTSERQQWASPASCPTMRRA